MLCAIGVFAWSVVESKREGGGVVAIRRGGQSLAVFFPPSYRPVAGSVATPEFRTAIAHYVQRDYAAAIPGLASVDSVEARFYLGICNLYTGNHNAGIAELQKVIAAGDTPYLEQARFYLAKGLIKAGNLAGAREQLNLTIALHGDMDEQAEALLARLK
jgi:TolA-binding protein